LLKPIRRKQLRDTLSRITSGQATSGPRMRASESDLTATLRELDLRILIAEDNLVNQLVVHALLRKAGIHADLTSNGQEALSALAEQSYDMVLMDCQMPVLDGYAACRAIREGQHAGVDVAVPVIALTANALDTDREKCLDAGMDDYLTKPIRPDELFAAIARAVHSARGRGRAA
jgi:two-component system sensor histidine kinase/response regulator